MKYKSLSIIFCLIIVYSCKNNAAPGKIALDTYKDTIITVDSLNFTESGNPGTLTPELAHKALLEYFEHREYYYPQEKISLDSLLANPFGHELTCIDFDTLYKIHLNNDKILDGVVTYYQMPCGANGNNWRPHAAMITTIKDKYVLINTEFIPDNFSIDSIINNNEATLIYCKEFDLGIREFTKMYKIRIIKN